MQGGGKQEKYETKSSSSSGKSGNDSRKRAKKESDNKRIHGTVGNCLKSKSGPSPGTAVCRSYANTGMCSVSGCRYLHSSPLRSSATVSNTNQIESPVLVVNRAETVEEEIPEPVFADQPHVEVEDACDDVVEDTSIPAEMTLVNLPSNRVLLGSPCFMKNVRILTGAILFATALRRVNLIPIKVNAAFLSFTLKCCIPGLVIAPAFANSDPRLRELVHGAVTVPNCKLAISYFTSGLSRVWNCANDFQGVYQRIRNGQAVTAMRNRELNACVDITVGNCYSIYNYVSETIGRFDPFSYCTPILTAISSYLLLKWSPLGFANTLKLATGVACVVAGKLVDTSHLSKGDLSGDTPGEIVMRRDVDSWSYKAGATSTYASTVSIGLSGELVKEFFTSNATLIGTANRIGYYANTASSKYRKQDGSSLSTIEVLETIKYSIHQLKSIQISLKGDTGVINRPSVTPFD